MTTATPAKFPLFDGHMHFSQAFLDDAIVSWDENNVVGGINLWGAAFGHYRDWYAYPLDYAEFLEACAKRNLFKRFAQFYWPDWRGFGADPAGFVPRLCKDLRQYAAMGCRGLKVWKDLGMFTRFVDGTPAFMDDPRLTPVWETCTDLAFTIAIHTADPSRGWDTNTQTGITREELFERRDRIIAAWPRIRFILCHSGNYIEDTGRFAQILDRFPHVNADLTFRPAGIVPQAWTAFLESYADRLYIGPDLAVPKERPVDRAWSIHEVYGPWRRNLLSWDLTRKTIEKIAWRNGVRDYIPAAAPSVDPPRLRTP